jgi:hypothetical protein
MAVKVRRNRDRSDDGGVFPEQEGKAQHSKSDTDDDRTALLKTSLDRGNGLAV